MTDFPQPGPRIAVVGITGSGKTTTARRLALIYGIPHVELDALHWQPNWKPPKIDSFRRQVLLALAGPAWVTDGNYSKVRDLIWPRATGLVWLDYQLPVILWQLTRRTIQRVASREILWNSNHETLRGAIFSKDSLFIWALQTYLPYRRTYSQLLSQPENRHLKVFRLHNPKETGQWLAGLETASGFRPASF